MTIAVVYVIFADINEALRIGRTVVEERLAACINVLTPCTSIYRWEGKIEQSDEAPAILKTTVDRADALIERIADLHSYEVPAITAWSADRMPALLAAWIEENSS